MRLQGRGVLLCAHVLVVVADAHAKATAGAQLLVAVQLLERRQRPQFACGWGVRP